MSSRSGTRRGCAARAKLERQSSNNIFPRSGMVLLPRPARLEPLASVFSTTGGFGSPPKPVYTSLNGVLTPAPGTSTHQNPVYAARELDTAVGRLRTAAHRRSAHANTAAARRGRARSPACGEISSTPSSPLGAPAGAAHRCVDAPALSTTAPPPAAATPLPARTGRYPRSRRAGEPAAGRHAARREPARDAVAAARRHERARCSMARLAGAPAPARRRPPPPPSPSTFSARSTASAPPPTTADVRAVSQCRHTRRTGGRRGRRAQPAAVGD